MNAELDDRRSSCSRQRQGRRRRYPRVRVRFGGFYHSRHRNLMARGGNLNFRGVFVPTAAPDEPGTQAMVRLELAGRPTMVRLSGRVVWSNSRPERGPVGMGIRFDALAPWQIKHIAAVMLRTAGFQALPQLQGLR